MEGNNWWHVLKRDQCLAIVAVQIVELINSSNESLKFMQAAHSNLQGKNTIYSTTSLQLLRPCPYKTCALGTLATHVRLTCAAREAEANFVTSFIDVLLLCEKIKESQRPFT